MKGFPTTLERERIGRAALSSARRASMPAGILFKCFARRSQDSAAPSWFCPSQFSKKLAAIVLLLVISVMVMVADNAPLQPVAEPSAILKDLQRNMSSLHSMYLEFTQERHLKLFTEPLKSEGVMFIERPDKIRWETTAPYQSILLSSQQSVAQFEYEEGRWKKLKMGFPQMLKRVMDQMVLMHQGKLDALTSDFKLSVATGAVVVVTMVPKDKNILSVMSSLEIHMAPDLSATREVVMNEPSGDLTRILFHREKRDVKFPPGTFDQTKPLDIAPIKSAADHAR